MVNITIEDVRQITDENLALLCDMLIRESNRRDKEKRTQIIENFHATFNAMQTAKIRIMYYPDIKALSFRYKLVLFADRIMNKRISEERDALEQIRQAAESGDVNRIKLSLEKQIMRCEKRMAEDKILS